jgi:hypothetical protein
LEAPPGVAARLLRSSDVRYPKLARRFQGYGSDGKLAHSEKHGRADRRASVSDERIARVHETAVQADGGGRFMMLIVDPT